jgi:hypothetical protein
LHKTGSRVKARDDNQTFDTASTALNGQIKEVPNPKGGFHLIKLNWQIQLP